MSRLTDKYKNNELCEGCCSVVDGIYRGGTYCENGCLRAKFRDRLAKYEDNEFTSAHQAFIALSAESIAIAFQTAKARERIESLLLESQRQAEALQAQEEELRSVNDELHMQAESRATAYDQQGSQS